MTPEEKNNRSRLPKFLLGGLALLVLAALLAIVLPRLEREERTLVSPIEVIGVPEGYVITRQSHSQAKIRIVGQPSDLNRADLFRLQVTLPENPDIEGVYPVVPLLSASTALQILEITPGELDIRLAQTIKREIPVEVHLIGEPAPGFRLGNVTSVPATTLVSGPLEAVIGLKCIRTTPISVANASAPLKLEISAENTGKSPVSLTPDLFTILIQVEEVPSSTFLKGIPVTTDPKETRPVAISPETVDIEVTGPARLLASLKAAGGVTAVIDTRELKAGVFVRRAAITLPEGVSLIGAKPELFTVNIPPNS